jgi:hypothetical protein
MVDPKWKLRRLAPRALRVLTRRAAESPVLKAFETTLFPSAAAFIAAYDAAAGFRRKWLTEMEEGRGASAQLLKVMRGWLPLVIRDVPGFDSTTFCDKPAVPDDVIGDGERLHGLVFDYQDAAGKALSFKDGLLGQLDPAIATATKEVQEAEAADATFQSLQKAVRDTAEAFNTDLKAFRRSLGNVVGRSDKDYQKLRADKAAVADEDDDPAAPPVPAPVPPAAPGVVTPTA